MDVIVFGVCVYVADGVCSSEQLHGTGGNKNDERLLGGKYRPRCSNKRKRFKGTYTLTLAHSYSYKYAHCTTELIHSCTHSVTHRFHPPPSCQTNKQTDITLILTYEWYFFIRCCFVYFTIFIAKIHWASTVITSTIRHVLPRERNGAIHW